MSAETHSERVARQSGSNFYPAFRFVGRRRRAALCAVYAFSRMADDAVDREGDAGRSEQLLNSLQEAVARCYPGPPPADPPWFPELSEAIREFQIPQRYFLDLIDGCRIDLTKNRYETFSELADYCYHVAGTIGLICNRIFGAAGEPYEQYAVRLGTAFQLTNILRDVGTDWDLGRLYLPLEDLRRFRYSETELGQRVENRNFQDLMAFETDRARGCFRDAAAILRQNKLRKFLPSEMMRRF